MYGFDIGVRQFANGGMAGFKPSLTGRGLAQGNVGRRKQFLAQKIDFLEKKALAGQISEKDAKLLSVLSQKLGFISKKRNERFSKRLGFADGGSVGEDTVPALLTPGEFVINKESAKAFGYGKLGKINKYAKGGQVGIQKFANGGSVGGGVVAAGVGLSVLTSALGEGAEQITSAITKVVGIFYLLSAGFTSAIQKSIEATKSRSDAEKEAAQAVDENINSLKAARKQAGIDASKSRESARLAGGDQEDRIDKDASTATEVEKLTAAKRKVDSGIGLAKQQGIGQKMIDKEEEQVEEAKAARKRIANRKPQEQGALGVSPRGSVGGTKAQEAAQAKQLLIADATVEAREKELKVVQRGVERLKAQKQVSKVLEEKLKTAKSKEIIQTIRGSGPSGPGGSRGPDAIKKRAAAEEAAAADARKFLTSGNELRQAQRNRKKGRQERQFRNQQIRQSRRRAALRDRRARRYNTDQFFNAYNQMMDIDDDIAELARGPRAPGGFFNSENPEESEDFEKL